ncbi:hypothetical protein CPB83DRAFT_892301 [Crepidotus variabilis]|uniref:DUF6532 domain-containing protein n=1 Tax=Crepidotus variabilis TaxID=179855 RepID=A0A9P6EKY1_9AGAR|nr:hypothetical protein CPB83DRAFT_892301 [Crepidotus variabilis]
MGTGPKAAAAAKATARKKAVGSNGKLKDKPPTNGASKSTKENVPVTRTRAQPARSKQTSRWQEVIESEMNGPMPTTGKGKKRKATGPQDATDESLNQVPPDTQLNPMAPAPKRARTTQTKKPSTTPVDPSLMGAPMPSLGPSSTMTYGMDQDHQGTFPFGARSALNVASSGLYTTSAAGQQASTSVTAATTTATGLAVSNSFSQNATTNSTLPLSVGGTSAAFSTPSVVSQPAVVQPATRITSAAQSQLYQPRPQATSPPDFHQDHPMQPAIPESSLAGAATTTSLMAPAFQSQDLDALFAEDTLQQRLAENLRGPPLFLNEPEEPEDVPATKTYLPRLDDHNGESSETEDEDADDEGGDAGKDPNLDQDDGSDTEEDEEYGVGISQNPDPGHQDASDFYQSAHGGYNSPHLNDIDEQSPDEDERQAQLALSGNNQCSEQRDVLTEHRKRNHANRPPSEESLHRAARRQLGHLSEDNQTDEEEADDEMEEGFPKRAVRGSKSNGVVSATTLQFYTGTWADAINEAKKRYGYNILTRELFPLRRTDLHIAWQCLAAVIEEFKDEGRIFDSKLTHDRNMDIVVFQEAATYRGKLKTEARAVVQAEFHDLLTKTSGLHENQQGHHNEIGAAVSKVLDESSFHFDGVDEQGRTNNLAHPSIKRLCLEFFYKSGDHAIARKQAEFRETIPEHAVAVAATAIFCALDEYRTGVRMLRKFCRESYRRTYLSTLTLIEEMQAHEHHKAKWDQNRKLWAHIGCDEMDPQAMPDVPDIFCALDEYRTGVRMLRKFCQESYRRTYLSTLTLIEEMQAHEHHKAKWDRNRKLWAHIGCDEMDPQAMPDVPDVRGRFD